MTSLDHTPSKNSASRGPAAQVFYDGACPLCRAEIAHYRRLRGAERLHWVDISRDPHLLATHGIELEAALARLHVRAGNGNWHTGAWAFVELWSHLPGYRWLARLLRSSGMLKPIDRGYSVFARWRLQRRCASGACSGNTAGRRPHEPGPAPSTPADRAATDPHIRGERSCA